MDQAIMGRPKKAKTEAKAESRSMAFRTSTEYAEWVERLAGHNRSTFAGLVDQALLKYAREIGFTESPPER